ncbi:MAG: hypothetical protein INR72_18450, partial [Williamsia herbipolensis]|nr:hypothetical protein [Williamsia herbipolensis]
MALQGFDALHFSGTMWSVRTLRDGVGVDDLAEVRNGLRAAEEAGLTAESADAAVTVVQHLGTVLDAVDRQHAAAALVATVTGLQSLVLAWCTQAVLVARIGRARSAEWALARLRGLTLRRRLTTVLAEPVAAALVGSAVGLALAVPVAAGIARLLLDEAVPLEPRRAPVLVAAAAAVAGSLVALVVASIRPARLPLVDLLRRTSEPRTLSRTGAVVQAVGIVAASVVIAGIVTEQRITGPGVALLAPTLVAVLFSVVALRIAVPLVRVSAGRRRSRGTGAAGLLVVRRLARTPSALTAAVVVTIGVALAVSSAQTAAYAVRVQDDRAAAELGASTVLDVHVRSGVSFIDAVRHAAQADPGGTSRSVGPAAVAVESYTEGNGVGRLLAVDTAGLARFWNADWGGRTASDVRRMLRPTTGPSLHVTGDHLAITLGDVGDADGARIAADPSDTELFAVVENDRGWHRVVFGAPRDGTLTTDAPCEAGCRVVMLGIDSTEPSGAPFALGATVLDLAGTTSDGDTDRVTRAWLAPERWRDRIGDASTPRERPSGAVGERSDGLRVNWVDPTGTGRPAIATRDVPEPLPALVGAATDAEPFPGIAHATAGIGLDGSVQLLRVSGRAPSLPRVLDDGALVDLELANRATDPAGAVADHEV